MQREPTTPPRPFQLARAAVVATALLLLAACGAATSAVDTAAPTQQPAQTESSAEVANPAPAASAALTASAPTTETAPTAGAASITETAAITASAELPTPTLAPTAAPAPTVSTARTELFVDGLAAPVGLVNAADGSGRLFALEKVGNVVAIAADGTSSRFLTVSDRVGSSASEQGLLGLAFAPDFASSGRFYINYTNRQGNTVISRLKLGADGLGDAASEEILLTIAQPAPNHNGGNLLFGPDGMLWIGTGDGGGANDSYGNGQNPAALLGKMLRIDVSGATGYTVPADNPWVEATWNGQEVADEIWAVGLRNPWRYSWDRATGDLWIADVGQNIWEEVNRVPAGSFGGLNFGWPIQEAQSCFQSATCDTEGLEQPVVSYNHSGHCSITGGYVYRGAAWPAGYGAYIYGDYCSGYLWAAIPQADGSWQPIEIARTAMPISAIGEDEAGELYVVDYRGAIQRLILE